MTAEFAARYGPWAVIAGASDGVGALFAQAVAERGVNVVLLARRQAVLEEVAADIEARTGVQTRSVAVDLAAADSMATLVAATEGLDIGLVVYCAGADADYRPFLANSLDAAEAMVSRNCVVPMRMCHHFAPGMVERGRGGIVIFGSGAGFMGAPNMAAYAASKAFDMVFAEALWGELRPVGVDVIGLILGETDTPALRRLRHERGLASSPNEPVPGAATPTEVVDTALANLGAGPTVWASKQIRRGARVLFPIPRNTMVKLTHKMSARAMEPPSPNTQTGVFSRLRRRLP